MILVWRAPDHRDVDLTGQAFSPGDVAVMLGFCRRDSTPKERHAATERVRRLIKSGKLQSRRVGAFHVVMGAQIAEYLDGHDDPTAP